MVPNSTQNSTHNPQIQRPNFMVPDGASASASSGKEAILGLPPFMTGLWFKMILFFDYV